jgi:hypothetical protein
VGLTGGPQEADTFSHFGEGLVVGVKAEGVGLNNNSELPTFTEVKTAKGNIEVCPNQAETKMSSRQRQLYLLSTYYLLGTFTHIIS